MLSSSAATLLAGAGIGFSVAAPIGPIGILCIQRTLTSGLAAGLLTGLGAATVHVAYGAAAVAGLGAIAKPWLDAHAVALGLISAAILLGLAARAGRTTIALEKGSKFDSIRLSHAYLSTIIIGLTNPLTPILFFAALQTFGSQSSSMMVAGVFLGSVAWWITLSGFAAAARARLNANLLALCGRLAGLSLVTLGAFTLARIVVRGFG
jgi:threonine/homoserine/homoserine lactone efflux protein